MTFRDDPARIKRDFSPEQRAAFGQQGGRKGGPIAGARRHKRGTVQQLVEFQKALRALRLPVAEGDLSEIVRASLPVVQKAYLRGYEAGRSINRRAEAPACL